MHQQVARCTKIINAETEDAKYIINVKQYAKFVVDLADKVAPTDIEEGMRVGYDDCKHNLYFCSVCSNSSPLYVHKQVQSDLCNPSPFKLATSISSKKSS